MAFATPGAWAAVRAGARSSTDPEERGIRLQTQGEASRDRIRVNKSEASGTFPTDLTRATSRYVGRGVPVTGAIRVGTSLTFPKIVTASGTLIDNAPPIFRPRFFSNAVTARLVP